VGIHAQAPNDDVIRQVEQVARELMPDGLIELFITVEGSPVHRSAPVPTNSGSVLPMTHTSVGPLAVTLLHRRLEDLVRCN
jgi:hypothetical protein